MKHSTLAALVVLVCLVAPASGATVGDTLLADPGKGDGPTSGTAVLQANDGPTVSVAGGKWLNFTDTVSADDATRINMTYGGALVVDGDTGGIVTIPSEEYLNESEVSVIGIQTSGTMQFEPDHIQPATVGQSITSLTWHSDSATELNDGVADFTYAGTDGQQSTVALGGVQANTWVAAVDADSGDILDIDKSDGSGNVNFTALPNSEHTVEMQTLDAVEPDITDIDPSGPQSTEPSELTFNVSDGDFGTSYGDEVDVTAEIDGTEVLDTTITSDSELSASIPASSLTAGDHSVEIIATDSYDNSETELATYIIPYNLTIYDVTSPTQVVDSATADLTFYGPGGDTVTRSTSTGTLDLSGLPVTEEMAVTISADGYRKRTTYIETIFDQQRAYLVPDTVSTANIVFSLDDQTGEYPPTETTLLIQRPITRDYDGDGENETQYETVSGDRFDAAGEYVAQLEPGVRYRIVVENQDDDQRVLGQYTPTGDDAVRLRVGEIQLQGGGAQGYAADLSAFTADRNNDGVDEQFVRVAYQDPADLTSTLYYEVRDPENDTVLVDESITDTLGTYVATYKISNNASDGQSFQLVYNATRDGSEVSGVKWAGAVDEIGDQLPIDPWWLTIIGLIGIVAVSGLLVLIDPALGAIGGTVTASILSVLGIVAIPMPALGLGAAISVIALVGRS